VVAIGGYDLLDCVSDNRPVSVWKGRDRAHFRDVAVKQAELSAGEITNRMRAQARVLTGLSHANIVEVLDLLEDDTYAWLVEEWVDGITVSALLDSGLRLYPEQAVGIILEALPGLAHAHLHAIVHGDISTANILLDWNGRAKLVNFGCSSRGRSVSVSSDLHDTVELLSELLDGRALELGRYGSAGDLSNAIVHAATQAFGPEWRDAADATAVIGRARAALQPVTVPVEGSVPGVDAILSLAAVDALPLARPVTLAPPVASAVGRGSSVQVRSTEKASQPGPGKTDNDEMVHYLQTRGRRNRNRESENNASRFIPLIAAAVVVAAIVTLVLTHHETESDSPEAGFSGTYKVSSTLLDAGIAADRGRPTGTVLASTWLVTSSCQSATVCTAKVKPSTGSPFTLDLASGRWVGELDVARVACPVASTGVGAVVYNVDLAATPGSKVGAKTTGTMFGLFAGCGTTGSSRAAITLVRAPTR
jgi:serine/threonine protein kinase